MRIINKMNVSPQWNLLPLSLPQNGRRTHTVHITHNPPPLPSQYLLSLFVLRVLFIDVVMEKSIVTTSVSVKLTVLSIWFSLSFYRTEFCPLDNLKNRSFHFILLMILVQSALGLYIYCSLFAFIISNFVFIFAVIMAMSKISGQACMFLKSKLLQISITYIWSKFL